MIAFLIKQKQKQNRTHTETQGKYHVTMEAEIGIVHLQAKEWIASNDQK